METHDLINEVVNQANMIDKGMTKMRAKYSFSGTPPEGLNEKFAADAKEFMQWHKIGIR